MRVFCFGFNSTFVAYNYTLARVFGDIYSLEIVFTQPGPEADASITETLEKLTYSDNARK